MSCPFAHPVACMLLCVVGSCFAKFETGQATSKRSQQLPTMLWVVICWPKLLRPFARGFRNIYHDFKQLLTIIHSVEIPSNIQYNTRLSKGGWKRTSRSIMPHFGKVFKTFLINIRLGLFSSPLETSLLWSCSLRSCGEYGRKVTRDLYKFAIAGLGWSPNINKQIRIITNKTKQRAF